MPIRTTFKYLGLELATTKAEILKNVKAQVVRYSNHMNGKACTEVPGIDNAIRSAYAKSLFLFMMPPLIANNLISEKDLQLFWAEISKKFSTSLKTPAAECISI